MSGIVTLDLGNGPRRYFNATAHEINLITGATLNPAIRKWVGGTEIAVIPPSGVILSAKLVNKLVADLGSGVTVAQQQVASCDLIPSEARGADYIIVSAMYSTAYRRIFGENPQVVTIRDLVVDECGKPRGCIGFAEW